MPEATLDDVPLEEAIHYACRDADATWRVYHVLSRRLDDMQLRGCYDMDLAIVPMVERMCAVGIRIDTSYFSDLASYLSSLMLLKVEEIRNAAQKSNITLSKNFNPNSPPQVAHILFSPKPVGFGFKSHKRTKGGADSTNDKVLESLRFKDARVGLICDYRELSKLRDSFCVTLPLAAYQDGRIHPNLQLTRVSSGRISCKEPNLLAIPVRTDLAKLVRQGFVAGQGCVLGDWDLDQIEMREMAHQSQDKLMVQIFNDGKRDVHRETAAAAFGCKPDEVTYIQRYAGKRLGFGVITGITEIGLSEQMALAGAEGWDEQACAKFIAEYFKIYPGIKTFLGDCRAEARRFSYVRDRWGRIRYLPGVHSELSWVRDEALRQSHSFKISASAQGILKHAMTAIWEWMKGLEPDTVEPLLQVHDELLFEIKDTPRNIKEVDEAIVWFLCNTTKLCVPIKAKGSTGPNWGVLKD
jgi:DNA polymerase-1